MDDKLPSNHTQQAYILRVSIKGIKPQIWRKLSVPDDYTLGDLHYILQAVFDWDDDHLHSFTVNSTEYRSTKYEMGMDLIYNDTADEDSVCLYDLDLQPKQKFIYVYDFGDSWKHEITVSQIIPISAENAQPRCLGGKRASPLEDSGGIWGYEAMLEALQDPHSKKYEEMHEWAGDFDPEYFNLEEINAHLEKIFKSTPQKLEKD